MVLQPNAFLDCSTHILILGIQLKNVLILDGMHTKNGVTAAARHFSGLGQLLREFSIRSIQTATEKNWEERMKQKEEI